MKHRPSVFINMGNFYPTNSFVENSNFIYLILLYHLSEIKYLNISNVYKKANKTIYFGKPY